VSTNGASVYRLARHLVSLNEGRLRNSPHHVKNSVKLVHTISFLGAGPQDILVSIDVVLFFTKVPTGETLRRLSRYFDEETPGFIRHVQTSSFFSFNAQFYEQIDGVAMGLPLFPVIANFFMQYFEEVALEVTTHKPLWWFRYLGDTFVIWPHGSGKLSEFLDHLNSVQFIMETERNVHLTFFDIDIYRKPDGSLGHRVYRTPTRTNLYLNSNSHNHHHNPPPTDRLYFPR
jgi:hypothetical protein